MTCWDALNMTVGAILGASFGWVCMGPSVAALCFMAGWIGATWCAWIAYGK